MIFSLDGIGLLGFEAALNRDYPIMFGTLYFFGLIGLVMGILGDIMYTVVDPRIDFESARLMNPMNRRRLAAFRSSKRGMISLVVFGLLFFVSLFAELLANNKPILIRYDGGFYSPLIRDYPETTFGGDFPTNTVYSDPEVQKLIEEKGWIVWPPDSLQLRHGAEGRRPHDPAAAVPAALAGHRPTAAAT